MQYGAREADDAEIKIAGAVVGLVDLAVQREQQPHRVFGDRVGRIGRHAQNVNFTEGRGKVDVAVTGAAHGQHPNTVVVQGVERRGVDIVIDEGADRVVAGGQFGSLGREPRLGVVDDVAVVDRVKSGFIVGLGVVKQNLFHRKPPSALYGLIITRGCENKKPGLRPGVAFFRRTANR